MQQKIAQANFKQRETRLDRCRALLFPDLQQIQAIGR
jgi:hypothetical protein